MTSKFVFNKTVADVQCMGDNDWVVQFDDSSKQNFTFVVICTGLVSVRPKIIDFPGSAAFVKNGGTIIHSSERRSSSLGEGKRVLVIGNGKSAVDAAAAAADIAKASNGTIPPPIQLARRQIWYVPRYILGFLQYKWAFHTRIGSLLQPAYYETPLLYKVIHTLFSPVKWILWRVVEILLLAQYRIPFKIWPTPLTIESAALETSVLITDETHLRRLRSKAIDMRIGTVTRLKPGKAVLNDGTEEDVDVIIQATGWLPGYVTLMDPDALVDKLGESAKDGLDVCSDGLWLYRNILPAGFRGMAFVGANTLTFINIYTSYIQAYWLAQLLANERPWPEQDVMKATIEREKAFKRKSYPNCDMRGASIELYMQDYHDVLFKEMKARKPFPWFIRPFADLIVPVLPYVMMGCLEPVRGGPSNETSPLLKTPPSDVADQKSGEASSQEK
jgi:dimethylaniline monooxygenase (N-oxide forming)